MHRARIAHVIRDIGWTEPHQVWTFECHEVRFAGHNSYVHICGEGTYRTWARALKSLRMHALGKHDFIL